MRLINFKTAAFVAMTTLLTACGGGDSGLDKKSAKELFQEASQHFYAPNAQYNFSSVAKIYTTVDNPFTDELKLKINGAIDNKAMRYEIRPEVEAGMINVKLPMLIDIKKQEVMIDPANVVDTIGMFTPDAARDLAKYKGKHVRFSLKNFDVNAKDLEAAMTIISETTKIAVGALNEFNAHIPESSIKKLDLDSKAKELNAKAKIRVDLDAEQSKELQRKVNAYFIAEVQRNEHFPADFKRDFNDAMLENDLMDSGIENTSSVMYLNDKGQVIHSQDTYNFSVENDSVSMTMTTDYSNYGKPEFKVAPKAADIVEFTQQDVAKIRGF